jgi:hypothetical protein
VPGEGGAKRVVGQDDGDDLIGGELPGEDPLLQAGGVLHVLENDLHDLDRHRRVASV